MEITNDLAYFLGVMCGDGYISPKGLIEIKGENPEYLKLYSTIVQKLFGKKVNISFGKNKTGSGGSYYRANFFSKSVSDMLLHFGLRSPKTFSVSVPKEIMNGNPEIKASFLRGVFDTDGCIFTQKNKTILNYPIISLKSRSHALSKNVKILLKSLELSPTLRVYKDNNAPISHNRAYGFKELKKYMDIIGFSHSNKMIKATKILKSGVVRKGQ